MMLFCSMSQFFVNGHLIDLWKGFIFTDTDTNHPLALSCVLLVFENAFDFFKVSHKYSCCLNIYKEKKI